MRYRLLPIVFTLTFLLTACAIYKPARVLTAEAYGLACIDDEICIEDPDSLERARSLRNDAVAFVQSRLGPFRKPPRVLFCATKTCYGRFANPQTLGINLGTMGAVINETGWSEHIVRHELIHHWQSENFGKIATAVSLPRWYIEGMAYTLSKDPRHPLPHAPAQAWRAQFEEWIADGNDWRIPPR